MSVTPTQVPPLVDTFGRQVTYLRLSVTDRCNFRCTYCMAEDMEFLPKSRILSLEEMHRLAACFVELGVTKIRLTGGEPLVRNGILELVRQLAALEGLQELTMTTNGALLGNMAGELKRAGLSRLNISLDSLNAQRFKEMTRTGDLQSVLDGIEAARDAGFNNSKINAVLLAGINDMEAVDLARFALENDMDISFIEEMPLGEIDSHQRAASQISSEAVKTQLRKEFNLVPSAESTGGPSRYFQCEQYRRKVGFISPISDNFCANCNRVRLTTEGRLLLCLGNEHSVDLKQLLRDGASDLDLKQAIVNSMGIKPERHYFNPAETRILRFMNATGG